jgi:hypothetical protein
MGYQTFAYGIDSTTMGYNTRSDSFAATVIGSYNKATGSESALSWSGNDPLFVIGNGTSAGAKSNAMMVFQNGQTLIRGGATVAVPGGSASLTAMGTTTGTTAAAINATDSSGSSKFYVRNDGNVGVGTTAPNSRLDVKSASSSSNPFRVTNSVGNLIFSVTESSTNNARVFLYDNLGTAMVRLSSSSGATTYFNGTQVGIGTSLPTRRLEVPWLIDDTAGTSYFGSPDTGNDQVAVTAVSSSANAISATSASASGVMGTSQTGTGVAGFSGNGTGILGTSLSGTSGFFAASGPNGTAPTLVIQQNGASTADLFQAQDSSGASLVKITSAGNVGIGTTTPSTKLEVAGIIAPSTDSSYTLGTAGLRWSDIYSLNAANNTSDLREKRDIAESDLGLEFIERLRPVSYRWVSGPDIALHYGLIAQETERVIKDLRQDDEMSIVTYNRESDRYGIRYTELTGPIIKAIQELAVAVKGMANETSHSLSPTISARAVVPDLSSEVLSFAADVNELRALIKELRQENAALRRDFLTIKDEHARFRAQVCEDEPSADICHQN